MEQNVNTPLANQRWLITGGCGFIGTNLIQKLLEFGVRPGDIRIIDNYSVGSIDDVRRVCPNIEENAEWGSENCGVFCGDIRDLDTVLKASQGADRIIHLAACTGVVPSVEDPFFDCTQNVIGTLNVLESARKISAKGVVFASSSAPVGMVPPPVHEGIAPNPASPYGASKLAGEGYCMAYHNCFDVPATALRFGNVYGPFSNKKSSIIAKFVQLALAGKPLTVFGDGTATRDYIHTSDLCDAIIKASCLEFEHTGQIYQIASSYEVTVSEIVEKLIAACDKRGIKDIKVDYGSPRQGDVQRNFAIVDKARDILGWEAKIDLDTGILQVLDWQLEYSSSKNI